MASSTAPTHPVQKKSRQRSPSYPGVDLETALDRAAILRNKEGRNFTPVNTVVQHWGYAVKSSTGFIVLAALKKFGLLEDQGAGEARRVRLTSLAHNILIDERPNSPERLRLIQDAAMTPPIHAELWHEFDGSMPSDANLKYMLRSQRGFSDAAVGEFIDEFKRTIAFAKLEDSDMLSWGEEDASPRESEGDLHVARASPNQPTPGNVPTQATQIVSPAPNLVHYNLPLVEQGNAVLSVPAPLSQASWNLMMAVLQAMKPGIAPEVESPVVAYPPQNVPEEPAAK